MTETAFDGSSPVEEVEGTAAAAEEGMLHMVYVSNNPLAFPAERAAHRVFEYDNGLGSKIRGIEITAEYAVGYFAAIVDGKFVRTGAGRIDPLLSMKIETQSMQISREAAEIAIAEDRDVITLQDMLGGYAKVSGRELADVVLDFKVRAIGMDREMKEKIERLIDRGADLELLREIVSKAIPTAAIADRALTPSYYMPLIPEARQ